MCWSAPVSMTAFVTSMLLCIYLWQRHTQNDRPLAIWIAWIALMQLFEFFMWRDMKNHTLASKLSYITTILQPFVLAVSLYYYYYYIKRKNKVTNTDADGHKPFYFFIILLSAIQGCAATFYAFVTETKSKWLSVKGPHCHLIWWYKKNQENIPFIARVDVMYFLTLLGAVFLIKPLKHASVYAFIAAVSFTITYFFYGYESGSLWCWIVNLLALVTIFMPYIKVLN